MCEYFDKISKGYVNDEDKHEYKNPFNKDKGHFNYEEESDVLNRINPDRRTNLDCVIFEDEKALNNGLKVNRKRSNGKHLASDVIKSKNVICIEINKTAASIISFGFSSSSSSCARFVPLLFYSSNGYGPSFSFIT